MPLRETDPLSRWKCYGITTADRPDREARMRRELEQLGLPFSISAGERPTDDGGFPNIGFHGCFTSHLASLHRAREEGVDVAILVEDDVVIARQLKHLLPSLVEQLDSIEWSIFYLGFLNSSPIRHSRVRRLTENIAASDGWEVIGGHFVAISGDWIDSIIENFEARLMPGGHRISPDGVLNEFRRDNGQPTLICLPNLAHQGPSPSGISPGLGIRHRLLRYPWVQSVAWPLKRVWWDLGGYVPPRSWVRRWNGRV